MTRWFLVTLAWRPDGLTHNGVDLCSSKEAGDTMGRIAAAWFEAEARTVRAVECHSAVSPSVAEALLPFRRNF